MDRRKTPPEDVERLNREMNAPEDPTKRRREAEAKSAMRPTSGAAIPQAFAGAQMAAEGRSDETSETAESLKRAAENDGRV